MAELTREVRKENDALNEDNSWSDVARREWQTFGQGTAEGFYKNGLKHYEENPLAAARDVGIGVALQLALKGPGVLRFPAIAVATIGAIDFAGKSANVVQQAVPLMQETALNPASAEQNREWAQKNLGPIAFELGVMTAAGAVTGVGTSTFRRLRAGEPSPMVARNEIKAETPAETIMGARAESQVSFDMPAVQRVKAEFDGYDVVPFPRPQRAKVEHQSGEAKHIASLLAKESDYQLISKMERGTRGAWLVESPDGKSHIFKLVSRDDVTSQIARSADSAAAADAIASRTPKYERVEFTPGYGSWYVQSLLPGKPAPVPSDRLIFQMVRMNDRQAGKATTTDNNWSQSVMDAVFKDSKGWQRNIAESGPEGRQLVADVRRFVAPYQGFKPRNSDVVHGDFQHYNALVGRNDKLTGYVDWEGAGNGDRGIDLSRLLYDAYVSQAEIGYRANPATLKMLAQKIQDVSGREALNTYMGHWILQVADYGVKKGPRESAMFMGVGRQILNDLKVMNAESTLLAAV